MGMTRLCGALCLFFAGMVSMVSGAAMDTITGVCSDSINGMLIDSVTVSGDGGTAISDSKGAFTIVVSQTGLDGFVAPRNIPSLTWHADKGVFSWPGYAGRVSIIVHSINGNVAARAISGKNLDGNSFSLARLPQGIYLVAIAANGLKSVYKVSCIRTRGMSSFSLLTRNSGPVTKTAATATPHTLTFIKKNFDTLRLSIPAGTATAVAAKMYSQYPLKNILKLFLDPTIPETGPQENPTALLCLNQSTVPDLIGGQLNKHDFVLIGENCRRINLVIGGQRVWHYDTENDWEDDDIWVLSNGNVLHAHMRYVEEITPKKVQVFRFPANGEIHTVMPVGLDSVYYIENHGSASDVNIYSIKAKATVFTKVLPELNGGQHTQCRRLRYTSRGTYLCAAMNAQTLFEYDKNWNLVWSFKAGSFWQGIPLKNGNYLIQRENAMTAVEFKKNGASADSIWGCSIAELKPQLDSLAPGLKSITATQTNERLSNGNTIIFTRFNDAGIPQAIEVTPDKKIVWILKDWKNLGDAVSMFMLDEPGYPEVPGSTNH